VRSEDLTGKVFSRLTVVRRLEPEGKNRHHRWECLCECGAKKITMAYSLNAGMVRSCGCLRKEMASARSLRHGHSAGDIVTSIYRTWQSIHDRCYNPNHSSFRNYGGRGLTVCSGFDTFEKFIAVMGEKPTTGHSIDRIDNDLGYFCGKCDECVTNFRVKNCEWATKAEQGRNRRTNVWIEFNGERKVVKDWEKTLGIKKGIISSRIKRGKTDPAEILSISDCRRKKE